MGKRVEFRSLKEAAQRMPGMIGEDTKSLIAGFSQVAIGDLAKTAIAKTPTGPGEEAARRAAAGGSQAYGHMKGRWFFVPARGGGKIPAGSGIAPPFKKSGDSWRLVNDAAHARVIEMGRQESKPIKRKKKGRGKSKPFTRMLGSVSAPNGVLGPSISQQMSTIQRLQAKAIRKAER